MSAEIHVNSRPMLTQAMFDNQKTRDQFACAAMQGMLAYPGDQQRGSHHNNNDYAGVAEMAYAYADAMLKERAK